MKKVLLVLMLLFIVLGCDIPAPNEVYDNLIIKNVSVIDSGSNSASISYTVVNNNSETIKPIEISILVYIRDINGKLYTINNKATLDNLSEKNMSTIIQTQDGPDINTVVIWIESFIY